MDYVAVAVLARLNTAIMALKAASEEVAQAGDLLLPPLLDAMYFARIAETLCKRRLGLP